ncbi:MAG: T9SS type A sorting domain-containing protein [Flavobacteriaceae bacterium]|nr:T9SS type A sorting domain-containing protein [Flavobacteriaceae bacterium]
MKGKLLVLLLIALTTSQMQAQSCNCDVTLTGLKQTSLNLIWASQTNYSPGDTICIPVGSYRGLRFYDFEGTAAAPLTIINCGGKVEITENQYSGIAFKNSKHIRLTGTGDAGFTYGIHIAETTSGASVGVGLEDLSTDFEIDHIEIENTGFAGIMAKTDPSCSKPQTWRVNGFVLENLNIHDNYIHDTGAEGIYVGYTGGYKVKSNRVCNGTYRFGHWLKHVDIHHNILEDIAWDGIQVNLVNEDGKIHDNTIVNYGTENRYAQDFAMSIGGGIYEVYNNYMENSVGGTGQGMQFISAESGTKIYNNVLVRPDFHGIFMHNRHEFDDLNEGYYIVNNTIIEPDDSGTYYNTVITQTNDPNKLYDTQEQVPTYFVNNLIVDPGNDHGAGNTWKGDQESYFDFNKRIERDSSLSRIYTNLMTRQMDTLGLTDIVNDDYSPFDTGSDLVEAGSDVSAWGIGFDCTNLIRPQGTDYDIGAYELLIGTALSADLPDDIELYDVVEKQAFDPLIYPNPVRSRFRIGNVADKEVQLQLIGFDGRILFEKSHTIGTPIAIEEFASGLYFLRIITGNGSMVRRLVIQ